MVVGSQRLQDSIWLPPILNDMDDMMRTTATCTRRLLAKLNQMGKDDSEN